jgi:hypothetical protein
MEQGFLRDTVLPGGHLAPQQWIQGRPPVDGLYTAPFADPIAHAVYAFRCVRCGPLALFVPAPAA